MTNNVNNNNLSSGSSNSSNSSSSNSSNRSDASRVQQATSWLGQGLSYTYQTMGSFANLATSYLPSFHASPVSHLATKIDQLTEKEFTELLTFISSGDSPSFLASGEAKLDTPQRRQLLREIVNNWEQVVTLSHSSPPHMRLQLIVGTSQKSPLVLFRLVHEFRQENLWSYLKDNLIMWPSDNTDEAVIRNGLINGQWTAQFDKDCGRSNYVVRYTEKGKPFQKVFPVDYQGNKATDLQSTLQKLPVFAGTQGIPFPVQECLSQKTALIYLTFGIWNQFSDVPLPPLNCSQRTLMIEEGDSSYFCLSVQERMTIGDSFYFDYNYSFKISKMSEGQWTTELVSLSFMQPQIHGEASDFLFGPLPSQPIEFSYEILCNSLVDQLKHNLEAAEKCQDSNALSRIEAQMTKQWLTLITKFKPEILLNSDEFKNLYKKLASKGFAQVHSAADLFPELSLLMYKNQ